MNPETYINELYRIAKGAGVFFFGQFFGVGLFFLTYLVIARTLGPEMLGIYTLGYAVYKILGVLSVLGTDEGLLKFLAIHKSKGNSLAIERTYRFAMHSGFLASLIGGSLLFLCSPLLSQLFFDEPGLTPVLRLFAVSLPMWTVMYQTAFALRGLQRITAALIIRDVIYPLVNFVLVVMFLYMGFSVPSTVVAHCLAVLGAAVSGVLLFRTVFPRLKNKIITDWKDNRVFFSFSVSIASIGTLTLLMNWTDTIMLGYFRSSAEVGVYSAAARTGNLVSYSLTGFNALFVPTMAGLFFAGEMLKLHQLYRVVTRWTLIIGSPVCFAFILFPDNTLKLFGNGFEEGKYALIFLCLGQLVNLGTGSVGYLLTMTGKEKAALQTQGIAVVLNVILNFILIPRWGINGAAVATSLSIAGLNLLRLTQVYHFYYLHPVNRYYFMPYLAVGISSFLIIYFISIGMGEWYFQLPSFIIIYSIVLAILGGSEEERLMLKGARNKLAVKFRSIRNW